MSWLKEEFGSDHDFYHSIDDWLILVGGLEHFLFFHNIWDNPSH
jgi:hypothetical protein